MHLIPRFFDNLLSFTKPGKVLVLLGPRQVGKTTLVKKAAEQSGKKVKYDTGDDYRIQEVWGSRNLSLLEEYVRGYNLVIVDEAQRVPAIGTGLKLLVDAQVPCTFIITGSASMELAGQVGEPLTGRKTTYTLYHSSNFPACTIPFH